ncbi:asparaginase [Solimonas soli]|uniref:asparaginase n=1 Tax=Solimonas soli TaxID=413479 RepID=UPI0004852683|nr:asparaginase [Solimonas soli]
MKIRFAVCMALLLQGLAFAGERAWAADALPKVRLFTTGGTIQSRASNRDKLMEYNDGPRVTPSELIADLPELAAVADVSYTEISNVGSGNIDTDKLLALARSVNAWLAQPDAAGAVVTHGTATLEETAYFLNLVIRSAKPVVVVGAMHPFSAISRDGPMNLYNSVRVAASREAAGQGVMVLLNDEIDAARDVTKNNTYRVDTFVSRDLGPIGFADSDRIVFYRRSLKRHTSASEFDVGNLKALPKVDIVYGYQEADRAAIDALIAAGARGIVLDDGATAFRDAVRDGQAKGAVFVQSDRKGSGRVLLSQAAAARGVVTADNLNAQKSRVLLRLALTKTSDPKEIQRMFNEY